MTALIVFLCAGTSATGAGHVTRCLALAGAYRDAGWRAEFIMSGDAFAHLLDQEYWWHVVGSGQRLDALMAIAPHGCDMLVIDDYDRDEEFEADCRDLTRRLVVLDDQTGRRHHCDVLVDAAAPDASSYDGLVEGFARILTGPKYALIRSSILKHRRTAIESRRGCNVADVLISFGATDSAGLTLKTIDAVADNLPDEITLTVALSSRAPAIEAVRSRCSGRIRLRVDADMGEVIAEADLAIGAGGVGAFERAALGLPGIVVTAAENQKGVARLLIEAGAALDGGPPGEGYATHVMRRLAKLLGDEAARASMARAAAALIDGRAAERIRLDCSAGTTISSGAEVRLRAAEFADEDWLLRLQREPETRRFARNPEPPSPEQHKRWLAATFEQGSSNLAIIEVDGKAAGMIRLDKSEHASPVLQRYEVSIAVSTAFHGLGIGSAALRLTREGLPDAIFDAFILPENDRSMRMFRAAGYIEADNGYFRSDPPHWAG